MKVLKTLLFGLLIGTGMYATADNNVKERKTVDKVEESDPVPCVYVHTVCDNLYPENHIMFVACMESNGC